LINQSKTLYFHWASLHAVQKRYSSFRAVADCTVQVDGPLATVQYKVHSVLYDSTVLRVLYTVFNSTLYCTVAISTSGGIAWLRLFCGLLRVCCVGHRGVVISRDSLLGGGASRLVVCSGPAGACWIGGVWGVVVSPFRSPPWWWGYCTCPVISLCLSLLLYTIMHHKL
jgi:hypothetical protein